MTPASGRTDRPTSPPASEQATHMDSSPTDDPAAQSGPRDHADLRRLPAERTGGGSPGRSRRRPRALGLIGSTSWGRCSSPVWPIAPTSRRLSDEVVLERIARRGASHPFKPNQVPGTAFRGSIWAGIRRSIGVWAPPASRVRCGRDGRLCSRVRRSCGRQGVRLGRTSRSCCRTMRPSFATRCRWTPRPRARPLVRGIGARGRAPHLTSRPAKTAKPPRKAR